MVWSGDLNNLDFLGTIHTSGMADVTVTKLCTPVGYIVPAYGGRIILKRGVVRVM